ncbi:ribonuclease III [Chloroflexota bacterium]
MADLNALQEMLGVGFHNLSLLEMAVVHSSYINENPGSVSGHNERLEFLGDAVLGFVVAEKLYRDFPDLSEGEMTRLRSALVCRDTLARVARTISLGEFLYMGKGEEISGGRDKTANLAGAMEAVIAAVFLDRGAALAGDFVLRLLDTEITGVSRQDAGVDYKSRLQELVQSRQQLTPDYRLVEAVGPEHDKNFTVEVMVDGTVMGRGNGKSKKLAEIEAARLALQQLAVEFTG